MIKSIKKKYLRKKKPKKIKGRYISKKQKGGTKKRKYISKKYKKRKYISKKKKGGSVSLIAAAAAEGAAKGAVAAAVAAAADTSGSPATSATSGSKSNSGVFKLSQDIKETLEAKFTNWSDTNYEANFAKEYDTVKETIFKSIDKSQICKIAEGYNTGSMFNKIKSVLKYILPNVKEMAQREFFSQETLDEECIISGILSKEIIQELLVIIYQNFNINFVDETIFEISNRTRTLQLNVAIKKYNNDTIKTNIVKILEAIHGSNHGDVRDKIVAKAKEIISEKTPEEKKKYAQR